MKPIPINPKYQVSESGEVFGPKGKMSVTMGFGTRYKLVRIPHPTERKPYGKRIVFIPIHRLVAEVFIGPSPSKDHVVRHLDDDANNNHVSNLCWGSRKENFADAVRNKKNSNFTGLKGQNNGYAKLSDDDVRNIRKHLSNNMTMRSVAKMFDISAASVFAIHHRKSWSHI